MAAPPACELEDTVVVEVTIAPGVVVVAVLNSG